MKKLLATLGALALLLAALLGALVLLVVLDLPEPGRGSDVESVPPVPRSLNLFQREDVGDAFAMTYGFVDHGRRRHDVTFHVSKADHAAAVRQFGANLERLSATANERSCESVKTWLDDAHSRYRGRLECEPVEGGVKYTTRGVPDDLFASVTARMASVYREELAGAAQEVGFTVDGDVLSVDHAAVVAWNRPYLEEAFEALDQARDGYDAQDTLGLFVAFVQEIAYEVPPTEWYDKLIAGLWVPAEVVVNNRGDCDSKADTFCALYSQIPDTRMIVVEVPGHALIGVRVPPLPGQRTVRIGNDEYVLCEVAGPGKVVPGHSVTVEGHFEYTRIDGPGG